MDLYYSGVLQLGLYLHLELLDMLSLLRVQVQIQHIQVYEEAQYDQYHYGLLVQLQQGIFFVIDPQYRDQRIQHFSEL